MPSVNQEILSITEPGSAQISERLIMIKELTDRGVQVIAVAMPWFPFDQNYEDLPRALSASGVNRVILATGVLAEEQRQQMISSGHEKIVMAAELTKMNDKTGSTKNGYTIEMGARIDFLGKMIDSFNLFGIKAVICTSDNHDLVGKTTLPLCQQFKHRNFKI